MAKLYSKYLNLKEKDSSKLYLFKSGIFYIFLEEDAKKISSITTLKLINYSKNKVKCGFPISSLSKYTSIFNNLNIDVEIIDLEDIVNKKIIKYIKNNDIDNEEEYIKGLRNLLNE